MNPVPPGPSPSVDQLPPEAIALAGRLFEAARKGQMDIFEQALPRGLSPNMTNEKGDSLVGIFHHWPFPSSSTLGRNLLFRHLIALFTSTHTLVSTLDASRLHDWSSILPRLIKTLLFPSLPCLRMVAHVTRPQNLPLHLHTYSLFRADNAIFLPWPRAPCHAPPPTWR